jgi:hypothetical protein
MLAFMSYQTENRAVAARVGQLLGTLEGVTRLLSASGGLRFAIPPGLNGHTS